MDRSFVGSRPWTLPVVFALAGITLSAALALHMQRQAHLDAEAVFQGNADRIGESVKRRFMQPLGLLNGAAGLFAALPRVDRAAFRAYAQASDMAHGIAGVRSLGFAEPVAHAALPAFVAAQRADEAPEFALQAGDVPRLDQHLLVKFIEPQSENASALGLDVFSNPQRREAVAKAVRSGLPIMSPAMPLVQDGQRRPGFVMSLPVYHSLGPAATAEQRQAAMRGVVFVSIVAADLLRTVVAGDARQADFELIDSSVGPLAPQRVFDSAGVTGAVEAPDSRFHASTVLPVPGRELTLRVRSSPAFDAYARRSPAPVVFAAGSLVSLLLAALLWQQSGGRRRAEQRTQQLAADLERLSKVAKLTSNAVIIADPQRRITWVNDGFERVTGYAAHEVIGRSPGPLLQFEGTDPRTVQRLRAALDAGRSFKGEILNRGKHGKVYWLDIEIQPLHDPQGALSGFMAIETDITERKQAEAALRANQAFLHNTGRIAGVGGWDFDPVNREMRWSEQTCQILDVEPDHVPTLGQCLALCAPPARLDLERLIAEGFAEGQHWDIELPIVTASGRSTWVRLVAEGQFEDGGLVRVVGALQDISARRAMQAEVARQEQLLRSAIDAIDEAFVLYDADDRMVFCNDKYRRIYSTSRDLIVPGARFEDIVRTGAERGQYKDAVGRVDEWVAARVAAHHACAGPLLTELDDGRVLRIVEKRMPDGHIFGFRFDITDLVRAREAAEHADRAKSDFIATISHELRTPLQAITGFSDLGQTFAEGQPRFQAMFADIHAGGLRMLKLVNGLLDVSKIDGRDEFLTLARRDVAALVCDVAAELTPLAAARQLRIDRPALLAPLPADIDAFRLQQVLRNVLANAIRFAPSGSAIEVACGRDESGLQITVRDHGPGIPPQELDAIFDAFVQSSRTRDGSGGTGLGLTICRRIMRSHGGSIVAANAAGGGALMTIRLPAPADVPGTPPAATRQDAGHHDLQPA